MNKRKAYVFIAKQIKSIKEKIKKGKYYEAGNQIKGYLHELDNLFKGDAELSQKLVDMIAYRRRIPLTKGIHHRKLKKIETELKQIFDSIKDKVNECEHWWLLEDVGGDLGGCWIDVICERCSSSVTLRSYGFTSEEYYKIQDKFGKLTKGDIYRLGEFMPLEKNGRIYKHIESMKDK